MPGGQKGYTGAKPTAGQVDRGPGHRHAGRDDPERRDDRVPQRHRGQHRRRRLRHGLPVRHAATGGLELQPDRPDIDHPQPRGGTRRRRRQGVHLHQHADRPARRPRRASTRRRRRTSRRSRSGCSRPGPTEPGGQMGYTGAKPADGQVITLHVTGVGADEGSGRRQGGVPQRHRRQQQRRRMDHGLPVRVGPTRTRPTST